MRACLIQSKSTPTRELRFDPVADITPVVQPSQGPMLVVSTPALPRQEHQGRHRARQAQPDMQEKLAGDGVSAAGGTPQAFGETLRRDIDAWRNVVQKAGVNAE